MFYLFRHLLFAICMFAILGISIFLSSEFNDSMIPSLYLILIGVYILYYYVGNKRFDGYGVTSFPSFRKTGFIIQFVFGLILIFNMVKDYMSKESVTIYSGDLRAHTINVFEKTYTPFAYINLVVLIAPFLFFNLYKLQVAKEENELRDSSEND